MIKRLLPVLAALALLAACNGPAAPTLDPTQNAGPTAGSANTPQASATAAPTVPTGPAAFAAVYPAGDPLLAELAGGELAGAAGLETRLLESLDELPDGARVLVAAPQTTEDTAALASLAADQPDLRLIVLGGSLEPSENVSVIAAGGPQSAFLAGYTAAMVTPDWRVGVLNLAAETAERDAALNGARYLCGICYPKHPPHAEYPLAADLAGPDLAQAEQGLVVLAGQGVATVVLTQALDRPEIRSAVEAAGLLWVSTGSPPPDDQRSKWVASLSADPAGSLLEAWQAALAGQPGSRFAPAVGLAEANPDFLGEPRQRLVLQVAEQLSAGEIFPGAVPLSD